MTGDENEKPGEPKKLDKKELWQLYEMYLSADPEDREVLKGLFSLADLPIPFTLPQPPEEVKPAWAIAALRQLIKQSQALARENARVMLGVQKIDEELGNRMLIETHMAQRNFQGVLQDIIRQLEQKGTNFGWDAKGSK
jgi:hypothetical protein